MVLEALPVCHLVSVEVQSLWQSENQTRNLQFCMDLLAALQVSSLCNN